MTLIAQMGALLLQGVTTAAEATLVRQAGTGPGWYVIFTQITSAASVLVFLVLMLMLIPALVRFRKTAAKLDKVLDHIERSIEPVTKHASHIADNVDYISTSIRADVQDIRRTLLTANSGVREVIESSERRLHELGALLRLVQEEAEQAFVSTASTIRGVRAGAAVFRENGARLADVEDMDDADELDDLEDLEDLDDDDFEAEESPDTLDELEALHDDDEGDSDIDTINDLDAAVDAAEDMNYGNDNGPAFGQAKPRIKRPRRSDRG
jgi:uncharacterized protein YoxC